MEQLIEKQCDCCLERFMYDEAGDIINVTDMGWVTQCPNCGFLNKVDEPEHGSPVRDLEFINSDNFY